MIFIMFWEGQHTILHSCTISVGIKRRYHIKCARRVSGITFISVRSKSKDYKAKKCLWAIKPKSISRIKSAEGIEPLKYFHGISWSELLNNYRRLPKVNTFLFNFELFKYQFYRFNCKTGMAKLGSINVSSVCQSWSENRCSWIYNGKLYGTNISIPWTSWLDGRNTLPRHSSTFNYRASLITATKKSYTAAAI